MRGHHTRPQPEWRVDDSLLGCNSQPGADLILVLFRVLSSSWPGVLCPLTQATLLYHRFTWNLQKAEKHVYIAMDYCSGGDLSQYIKARGRVESLQYVPDPGAAPIYFPHPKTGGLDERVVKSLLPSTLVVVDE
ncbi:hypothetical protein BC826DRAFT_308550 [Russula brevipes]|nr:hypothetical protein BC826DRAFT_308550 [Russula brevipes]